jgi:predicted ArsR family transcriptional regulator
MIRDYERQLFEKVLRTKMKRDEERIAGLYRCTYTTVGPA